MITCRCSSTCPFSSISIVRYPSAAQWQISMLKSGTPPASRYGRSHGSAASGGVARLDTESRFERSVSAQYKSASALKTITSAVSTQPDDHLAYLPAK